MIEFNALLEANYKNQSTVNFYTSRLNVTDKKLASTTKKYTGLSPLQVIHNRILLEAKRLLLFDDVSQKEIGYTLGFDSPASFSAFIKNKTGLPPSELAIQLKYIYK
jgi:AraC-like DNA-binding protein